MNLLKIENDNTKLMKIIHSTEKTMNDTREKNIVKEKIKRNKKSAQCHGCKETFIKSRLEIVLTKSTKYYYCYECSKKRIHHKKHGNYSLQQTEKNKVTCMGCGDYDKKTNMTNLYPDGNPRYKCPDCLKKHTFYKKKT